MSNRWPHKILLADRFNRQISRSLNGELAATGQPFQLELPCFVSLQAQNTYLQPVTGTLSNFRVGLGQDQDLEWLVTTSHLTWSVALQQFEDGRISMNDERNRAGLGVLPVPIPYEAMLMQSNRFAQVDGFYEYSRENIDRIPEPEDDRINYLRGLNMHANRVVLQFGKKVDSL